MSNTGAPTKYNQEKIDTAWHYLYNFEDYDDVIPSVAGLAVVLGVARETLHVWKKHEDKKELSNILDAIIAKQEKILISKGLKNEFNANITKLVLGKHGYHDNTKIDNTSSDGSMSPPTKIEIVAGGDEESTG